MIVVKKNTTKYITENTDANIVFEYNTYDNYVKAENQFDNFFSDTISGYYLRGTPLFVTGRNFFGIGYTKKFLIVFNEESKKFFVSKYMTDYYGNAMLARFKTFINSKGFSSRKDIEIVDDLNSMFVKDLLEPTLNDIAQIEEIGDEFLSLHRKEVVPDKKPNVYELHKDTPKSLLTEEQLVYIGNDVYTIADRSRACNVTTSNVCEICNKIGNYCKINFSFRRVNIIGFACNRVSVKEQIEQLELAI